MSLRQWRTGLCLLLLLSASVTPAETLPTIEAENKSVPSLYQFDGVVEAVNRATVSSRIAAEVIEINFDVNDPVPQDAVILRFSDDEIKARLMQAEANLLAQRAQYQEAIARQKEAQAEAGRVSDLYARKQVTRSALDKAEADKAAANARVNVLAAQVKAADAAVEEAKVALSYTVVRAPYAGVVTERLIEVGEMASPGQLLMSGVSLEALRVVSQIPQRLVDKLLPVKAVSIETLSGQALNIGESTLVPQADPDTHAFELRVALAGEASTLYPGSSVKVTLEGEPETLLLVPAGTIVQRSEVAGVYLLKGEQLQFRQVRRGRQLKSGEVEILAGLQAGDNVVTEPAQAVKTLQQNHD